MPWRSRLRREPKRVNRGLAGSYTSIGPGWAFAANSPFRLMKGYLTQGGIQVPCIMKLPGKMPNGGSRVDAFTAFR